MELGERGERGTHHEVPRALWIALWIILVLIPVFVPSAKASLCLVPSCDNLFLVVRGEEVEEREGVEVECSVV